MWNKISSKTKRHVESKQALIDEATAELHAKHNELVQSFKNEGFSEIDAKKQAFAAILPELRKELGNVYVDHLRWMSKLKGDPVHTVEK